MTSARYGIRGLKQLSGQLSRLGSRVGGKTLRRAALQSTLPALRAAQRRAPIGTPPYEGKDPYPVRSYKGRLRVPGFLKRNIARKSKSLAGGTKALVLIGPKPEAFYGTQFIELGTSKIPKRPWLVPAFRSAIPAVNGLFRHRLKKLMDDAIK